MASVLGLSLLLSGGAATASQTKLSTELLTVSQMPSGWSTDVQTGGSSPGCLAHLFEPLPLVSEKLGTYSNATTAFQSIVATLADCKRVSGVSGKLKVTGTIAKMKAPSYGDTSAAFAVKLDIQGTSIANDIVIVRKGKIVMGVEEANSGTVNVSQLQRLVIKALAKVH
jgi:hypothetical protein